MVVVGDGMTYDPSMREERKVGEGFESLVLPLFLACFLIVIVERDEGCNIIV